MMKNSVDKSLYILFHRRRYKIQWRRDRHYDHTFAGKIGTLPKCYRRKRSFANAKDDLTPLLEAHGRGPSNKRITNSRSDLANSARRGGNDDKRVNIVSARS